MQAQYCSIHVEVGFNLLIERVGFGVSEALGEPTVGLMRTAYLGVT